MGVVNLDIPFLVYFYSTFLLEHNVDEKIMRNIEVRIHVKLEVKVPIEVFVRNLPLPPPPHKKHHSRKNFDSHKKF